MIWCLKYLPTTLFLLTAKIFLKIFVGLISCQYNPLSSWARIGTHFSALESRDANQEDLVRCD